MALSINVLSDLIKTELEGSVSVNDPAELEKLTNAIATGVVNHITSSAEVTVDYVTGVTSGGATSGPGVGTVS